MAVGPMPLSFIVDLGFEVERDAASDVLRGTAELVPELCVPETDVVLASVLLTFADVVAGSLANRATLPRVCMTVDLNVRMLQRPPADRLTCEARVLKTGRTLTFTETRFTSCDGGEPFAVSQGTFVASPRPDDEYDGSVDEVPIVRKGRRPLAVPLPERVGATVVSPGVVEIERRPDVVNPADTIQGGVVALAAELAALSLAGGVPSTLDVRYLRATRVGPARAEAVRLSERTSRVEVRDAGDGARLGSIGYVDTIPGW